MPVAENNLFRVGILCEQPSTAPYILMSKRSISPLQVLVIIVSSKAI